MLRTVTSRLLAPGSKHSGCYHLLGILGPVVDDIRRWLLRSGFVAQSLDAVEKDLPRWERYLRERGVTRIPPFPSRDPRDARATSLLCMLVEQAKASTDGDKAHHLRSVTNTRPTAYKW